MPLRPAATAVVLAMHAFVFPFQKTKSVTLSLEFMRTPIWLQPCVSLEEEQRQTGALLNVENRRAGEGKSERKTERKAHRVTGGEEEKDTPRRKPETFRSE